MDSETLSALKATWERDRADAVMLEAKLDALVFMLCEEMKTDYEEFMRKLRGATKIILDQKLIQLEDRNPAFAARVRGWVDGEIPNFPLDGSAPPPGK